MRLDTKFWQTFMGDTDLIISVLNKFSTMKASSSKLMIFHVQYDVCISSLAHFNMYVYHSCNRVIITDPYNY